jgi:hypothetical protein
MKRISRGRYLTPEEAANYDAVRAAVEAEKPEINARILARMAAHPPVGSAHFWRVAKGLLDLHRLINEGKDDSQEADAIRTQLDEALAALDDVERERVKWLSDDLYSSHSPAPPRSEQSLASVAEDQLNKVREARKNGEWDQALQILRGLKDQIPAGLVSFNRGLIWQAAGHANIAAEFFAYASACDPANADYRAFYLQTLADSRPAPDRGEEKPKPGPAVRAGKEQ